jgi:hypothetical protein
MGETGITNWSLSSSTMVMLDSESCSVVHPFHCSKCSFYRTCPKYCPTRQCGMCQDVASTWLKEDHVVRYVKRFVACAKPSDNRPVLLLPDNNDPRLSAVTLEYWKRNGGAAFFFLHTEVINSSCLVRYVYAPLKTYVKSACCVWIPNRPDARMTVYDIPCIIT